ncbi:MAG: ATP-binding protein [Verrucomicrobia bacterium]|nr:ATP-binding protein [Verrucomicrobiota bacterium]
MTRKLLLPLGCAACLLFTGAASGQGLKGLNLRIFKLADGLAESACLSVTITPQGKVLVRHPAVTGISEFGGYAINVIPGPGEGSSRVYGSPGGQLWTVSRQGLQEFRDDRWIQYPVAEIVTEFSTGMARITDPIPLCPVKQGQVLMLLPDRLLEFSVENDGNSRTLPLHSATASRAGRFLGMTPARDGGLWIAGASGLAKIPGPLRNLKAETPWQEYLPPSGLMIQNLQEPREDAQGGVTMVGEFGTNHQRRLVYFDGKRWTAEGSGAEKLRQAWRGQGDTWWVSGIDSLAQWSSGRRETMDSEETPAWHYFDAAVEPGGIFWMATSDGLLRFAPLAWQTPAAAQGIVSPVSCIAADGSGRLWFVAGNALHSLHEAQRREYPLPAVEGKDAPVISAIFPLRNGALLMQSEDTMLQFNPGTGAFEPVAGRGDARRIKPLGLLRDGLLVVRESRPGAPPQEQRLAIYDGLRLAPFPDAPREPIPGTNLCRLFPAQHGDLWLSTERGTAWYHDRKWRVFALPDRNTPEGALCFAEAAEGRIWCATSDRIWEFDGRNWLVVRSGFDGIHALLKTRDGSLWVASNNGLHRFWQGGWIENGREDGLPSSAVREMCEDPRGRLWAGTARGLSLYHPEADTDPPRTQIQELTAKETNVPEGATVTLTFSGQDKWNYTRRPRLLYSHRLDGQDWSPFQPANNIAFIDLPAGKHYFDARAMDRNGNVDPNPARLEFAVILPWYKESRLVTIACAGLAVALFFAGLAFNRHRQLVRSYAEVEKKVADRTRELELANRALAHSQKMNALGTLAAGIAHDFNNILSIIKGSAQIIEENMDNPPKVLTRLDRIKTVVDQGSGIVKALLGFSRDSDPQPGLCDVNQIVEETLKLLGDRFLRESPIRFDRAPGLPMLVSRKDFIQQIVLNFVLNAAESMGRQPQAHIVLAIRRLDRAPLGPVLAPGAAPAYVAVSVQDSGCGIPPENLARIFEPFFTTKALSARRGTGLGLSMVYELARRMDAGLAVESVVDQGSIFTLILPATDAPSQEQS